MSQIPRDDNACARTRSYLDSYLSNELLVETTHEVLRHLEQCPECTAEAAVRGRIRARLKTAVQSQPVPPELAARVRRSIQASGRRPWFAAGWQWTLVAAAVAACAVAGVIWYGSAGNPALPALTDRPAQLAYFHRISAQVASILRVGLGDHVHCAVFRQYPKNPPPVAEMETQLGPEYKGLLPVVEKAVPADFRIVMAHHCTFDGRPFIHVTLRRGGSLLSLVIAHRLVGESMAGLPEQMRAAGVPLYEGRAERYQVASFETARFLVYVVSDLSHGDNLQLARVLAPGVSAFLASLG